MNEGQRFLQDPKIKGNDSCVIFETVLKEYLPLEKSDEEIKEAIRRLFNEIIDEVSFDEALFMLTFGIGHRRFDANEGSAQ